MTNESLPQYVPLWFSIGSVALQNSGQALGQLKVTAYEFTFKGMAICIKPLLFTTLLIALIGRGFKCVLIFKQFTETR